MKKLFYKDGELRWGVLAVLFSALTLVGIAYLGPEIATSFSERFGRSGIWQLLGPIAAVFVWGKTKKSYVKNGDSKNIWIGLLGGVALFWAGLFGPNVGFKEDRKASIPDNAVYYFNGKIKNATDSTKKDYYFKEFKLDPIDSLYVVQYGEEPGYSWVWRSVADSSSAPRKDEDWKRPVSRNAQKFEDSTRSK